MGVMSDLVSICVSVQLCNELIHVLACISGYLPQYIHAVCHCIIMSFRSTVDDVYAESVSFMSLNCNYVNSSCIIIIFLCTNMQNHVKLQVFGYCLAHFGLNFQ